MVYFVVVVPVGKIRERRRRGQASPLDDPTLTDEARLLTEIGDLLTAQRR